MKYKVVLHESEKGVAISCTSSSGCWSQGENTTEALCSIRDEIENYLLALDNSNFLNMAEQAEFVLRIPGPVVYLYKAGRYYKLGRTKNIRKRHKQIKLQLPFRAIQIHVMYTNDEKWLENYWHQEFKSKRENGEWFLLNDADVKRFCAESEKLKPRGITLDFSGEAQLISETQSHTFEIEEQPQSEKTATADEVKTFFQKSIYSHPQKERELAKALKYQLESLDKEIERLKSKLGYSELQALQEWKRKAIGSANKKIALVKE